MTDCLQKAKEAFGKIVDNSEIESIHDALQRTKDYALKTGANLAEALERRATTELENRERSIKAEQLQNLMSTQATVDNLLRIKQWQDAGVKEPLVRALLAKIGGSPVRIARARRSTQLKMMTARSKFLRSFSNRLHDDGTIEVWTSKQHQVEIVDAIMKKRAGQPITDPTFKKIADAVTEYQDAYVGGMREQGIDIKELDDRVAPNIHDVGRMMRLTRAEKLSLKESGQSEYRFLRDRWKGETLRLLDNDRILKQTGVDLTDKKQADEFMNNTFDELVNKGKVTQQKTNIANRLAKPRVLHWKDAASLIEYNEKYGSGAIQDSIVRELGNGFSRLEFTKDWGVNPQQTLENTLKLADLDPDLKDRFYKSKEAKRFSSLLSALGGAPVESSMLGDFMRNFRAFENITKLGLVTLRSIPDLGLLATESAHAGMNGFAAIGDAVKTVFFNLHPDERELFKDLLDTSYTHEIGSILKYDLDEPSASKIAAIGLRASNKLNFLETWDSRLRAQTLAVWSRRFAQSRKMDWEGLPDNDKSIFALYEINAPEWDLIRKSDVKLANSKEFITPDSIAQMSDEAVAKVMRKHGGADSTITPRSIRDFREETAKKTLEYLEDRQAHVILRPGVLDKDALTFGHGVPQGGGVMGELFKLFTQFKMYSVNYARVPLASVLYGKGATDFREATIGGKGDLRGMAKLTAYMMAMKYASMSATNLVQGLSPPSLSKTDTWLKMLTEGAGVYGLAADLDLSDLPGSLGKVALGPVGGDVARVGRLVKSVRDDVFTNNDFSKTSKSAYALLKSAVPKYPLSAYVMNNLMMSEFEDMASPGTRERYLRNLDQQQGVTPLF
jgi:hypothetical protein